MIGVTFFGIFLTPIFFSVIEILRTEAGQPAAATNRGRQAREGHEGFG
jgi:hypothetical protein